MDGFWHDMAWVVPLRTPFLTAIADGFNYLGYAPFFMMALPLTYWLWDKSVGTRLALLVMIVAVTNGVLKDIFDDPRPPPDLRLDPRVDKSYGLPSGHAQVATAMWLWIAYELRRRWFWPIAVFIAAGVCLSRLYVAVHDVEDITVGIVLGLGSIALLAFLISDRFAPWRRLPAIVQIGLLMVGHLPFWFLWPEPDGAGTKIAIGGLLVGWWAGVLIDRRAIHYRRHPNWLIAIAAAAAGLAIIVFGLQHLSAGLEHLGVWKVAARWLQYGSVGLFTTALAPWLFQKLGAAWTETRSPAHLAAAP